MYNHMQLIGTIRDIFPRREEPIYKTISSILKQQRSYYDQAMALYNLFGVNNPLLLELFFYKQRMSLDRLINTMYPLTVNNKSNPMRNACSTTFELLQYQRNIYDEAELAINMQTHMRLGIRTAIQFDKFIAFARVTLFEFQAASRKENDCKKSLTKRSSSFYETFSYWLEPMVRDCIALCLFLEEKDYKLRKNIEIDNDALRCIEELKQVQKTLTLLQEKMVTFNKASLVNLLTLRDKKNEERKGKENERIKGKTGTIGGNQPLHRRRNGCVLA